jgi:DNA polymerase-4
VWERLEAKNLSGRTVNLKVKYADFRIVTRARSQPLPVLSRVELLEAGSALLRPLLPPARGIRLLGLGLSNLCEMTAAAPPIRELELPL